MERVIRPGVFILAAVIWGLLFVGEALLCPDDDPGTTHVEQPAPATETVDDDQEGD